MILYVKKAQGLIEYLIVITIVGAIAVPFVFPVYNTSADRMKGYTLKDNDKKSSGIAHQTASVSTTSTISTPIPSFEAAPVLIASSNSSVSNLSASSSTSCSACEAKAAAAKEIFNNLIASSGTSISTSGGTLVSSPNDIQNNTSGITSDSSDSVITDNTTNDKTTENNSSASVSQKVYIFVSDEGCNNDATNMKNLYTNSFTFDSYTYGGIFNSLQGQAQTIANDYCKGTTYAHSVIAFNSDGTLHGAYNIDEVQKLNSYYLTGFIGHSNLSGKTLNLPGGEQVQIEDNAYYSPLVFDLDHNGIHTVNKTIMYDINGDEKLEEINDIDPKDGILIIRQGKSGLDLFGDNTDLNNDGKPDGFKNGFDALRGLALREHLIKNNIMKLNSQDIAFLEKKYKFAMKTGGYLGKIHSLKSLGITEISLGSANNNSISQKFDKRGNILMYQEGASFKIHNKTNIFADVWHKVVNAVKNVFKNFQHF